MCSGKKIPDVIQPLNEGGDGTNCPSPPTNFTFFGDPDVLFGSEGPPPLGPPGLPPGRPPAPSPAGDGEERV